VSPVGTGDNFFSLGGDSIITIQVSGRARKAGYDVRPRDIFRYQTVSLLATAVTGRTAGAVTSEQGLLSGESGLLPIQRWYFEGLGDGAPLSHYNQSMLFRLGRGVPSGVVRTAVGALVGRHDALRFRYELKDGAWRQYYGEHLPELEEEEMTGAGGSSLEGWIEETCGRYQRSLDIERGRVCRFVLLRTGGHDAADRLLVVVHHLAVDGVSWRVLEDDLRRLLEGGADLGSKGSSCREWYLGLEGYAGSARLQGQAGYWQGISEKGMRLPDEGPTGGSGWSVVRMVLDRDGTSALLQGAGPAYNTEINDLLLSALYRTLGGWSGLDGIVIGLEGHGREEAVAPGIDLGHTVGWFTSLYPVLLEGGYADTGDLVKGTKEMLRRVPDKGLGYGVLRYICGRDGLSGDPWDVVFNYLGQFGGSADGGSLLSHSREGRGPETGEGHRFGGGMVVNSAVQDGVFEVYWGYDRGRYHPSTAEGLCARYLEVLNEIISHCLEVSASGGRPTPSDYG
ncbi:condensation domain-containing protein, partial [Olivibacter sp. CPCC 100613]|uniref:condensation domain-containing protein n=1 Tax=Olivibacter sp. CPCC 100613 TaxID=3079931 RepID=UPI002FF9A7B7